MKPYYIGLYVLISLLIIYVYYNLFTRYITTEYFQEVSDYQSDAEFLKSLQGKDLKPKTRLLNLNSPILPQLEGIYQGKNNLENTYWKIDSTGKLSNIYGLYGTITVPSPQKTDQGYIYLRFKHKTGKIYDAWYNGSQYLISMDAQPFIIQLLEGPNVAPLNISNISKFIGNIKESNIDDSNDKTEYYISKDGFVFTVGTNRLIGAFTYRSNNPPYIENNQTYTFDFTYLDKDLQTKFGKDAKRAVLSNSKLTLYDNQDNVLISYNKVLPVSSIKSSPKPTLDLGFVEIIPPVLEGCKKTDIKSTSLYNTVCINSPYYIINHVNLLCLSIGSDGKTLIMQPIDKSNPNQVWIPRQYRLQDRYNDYDNVWCRTDFEKESDERYIRYNDLEKRAKWMRPDSIYPRTPLQNKLLQSKIDYRYNNNNADFILESGNTRSFVKGQFNEKTTLLDLSILPFTIETQKRDGYDFNTPIYENISPTCLYKCGTKINERDKILKMDSYANSQYKVNCRKIKGKNPPATKCADTRTQQFMNKYQKIECNDKYDNYNEMTRFRFEGNLLEVVTRVEDKYNSLSINNRQYVEANDKDCLIAYTDMTSDMIRQRRTWYFIPTSDIDRMILKLKEPKRNLPLEKKIYDNILKLDS